MKKHFYKQNFIKGLCLVLAIFIFLCQPVHVNAQTTDTDIYNLMYLQGIMEFIYDQYSGSYTDDELLKGATAGMLNSLDDYTTFYTPQEAELFWEDMSGEFGGIGIVMEVHREGITVVEVFSPSPAEDAGIMQGDMILEADGHSLLNATADEAASIIRGELGTKVRLKVLPCGGKETKYIDVVRDTVKINPVKYEIRGGIGYIKLERFNENADEFMTEALNEIEKKGITKIILDLRDNPGGDVDQAVAVARKFVPEGVITTLDYKSEKYSDRVYRSELKSPKFELAVLVNGMSASASELLSAAVQDTGVGKLVGTKTFGKAKFQGILPILTPDAFIKYTNFLGKRVVNAFELYDYRISPNDDEILGYTKMTLGLYYTPKGRLIDGVGLTADIKVPDPKPVSGIYIPYVGMLTSTAEPGLNGRGVDIFNAEMILKALGYKIGLLDNILDTSTQRAIKAYQKDKGLNITGILDFETKKALNSSRLALIEEYDKQYSAAYKYLN